MKLDWNRKYNTIGVYAFIVAASIIVFYLGISQLGVVIKKVNVVINVLQPFIIGFALTYLLGFILRPFENNIIKISFFKNISHKGIRIISLIFTYLVTGLLIVLFLQFVLPQLIDSIVGLVNNIPMYLANLSKITENILGDLDLSKNQLDYVNGYLKNLLDSIITIVTNLLPVLGNILTSIVSSLWNIVIGLIVSFYLLFDKERMCAGIKKVIFAIFPKNGAEKIIEITNNSNIIFGKFLSGKILDSTIIGVMVYFILLICKMPYVLLVSVIIGLTNIIPFFGPFIGAIPSFIIILFVSPKKAILFLLIIFIVQQIDGNIIGPKILGSSIGISAFWILFSIIVAGKFLGVLGMVIGVPLFAVIYSLIKELVEGRLKRKGLKTDTKDYMNK